MSAYVGNLSYEVTQNNITEIFAASRSTEKIGLKSLTLTS